MLLSYFQVLTLQSISFISKSLQRYETFKNVTGIHGNRGMTKINIDVTKKGQNPNTLTWGRPSKFAELSIFAIEEGVKMVARFLALLATIFGSSLLITVSSSLFSSCFLQNIALSSCHIGFEASARWNLERFWLLCLFHRFALSDEIAFETFQGH